MRALVIDDSQTVRLVLRRFLDELGFEVALATDGQDAVEWLDAGGAPDLMLVDWNMPRLDGLGVLQHVRADAAYDHVPVMMVTTESDLEHVQRALDAGATEYMMKPFSLEALQEKLLLMGLEAAPAVRVP